MTKQRSGWTAVLVLGALLVSFVASCSSDTRKDIKQTATDLGSELSTGATDLGSDISSGADVLGARATAEAIRGSLKANKDADTKGVRSVTVIQQVVKDLPGDPTVTGIADSNGDGLDDDGQIQVDQDGQSACVTLPPQGEDIQVTSGACGG